MGKIFSIFMLSTVLVASGCASKKKAASEASGPMEETSMSDLELMGDSDSQRAGPLSSVNFAFNSSNLNDQAMGQLQSNADFLNENSSIKVQVEGHCDERGGVQYNLALGENRANAVKKYLVALGVSEDRITTISFGKERPLAFGHDEDSWSQNRRGNFVITAK